LEPIIKKNMCERCRNQDRHSEKPPEESSIPPLKAIPMIIPIEIKEEHQIAEE
jgi:hypothetical protein